MERVTSQYRISPYEINNGCCNEWAQEVLDLLAKAPVLVEMWEKPFGFADTTHCFLRINGKFYDAEDLEGTDDHMGLPIFAKLFKETKTRQPVWLIDHNGFADPKQNVRDVSLELWKEIRKDNGTEDDPCPYLP